MPIDGAAAGAAPGAKAGVLSDIGTGGLTLGAGTARGALLGGATAWVLRSAQKKGEGDELLRHAAEAACTHYLVIAHHQRVPLGDADALAARWRAEVTGTVAAHGDALAAAREKVARALGCDTGEVFFTSCGSEADNWAVKGTAFTKARQNKKHLITSAFEHHAIMHSMAALERLGFEVTYIKPTPEGYIRPEDVELVPAEGGYMQGDVVSNIFKGVHYELEVKANGYDWMVHTTKYVEVGSHVGIKVIPFNIQVMHKPESSDEKAVEIDV